MIKCGHITDENTRIDYTLPALGGGFGQGFKVSFGYDLVGDDYTGMFQRKFPIAYPCYIEYES